jgi:hypothetical protein
LANQRCWPAQEALEAHVLRAFAELGRRVVRGHPFDPVKKHGFIDGQARGIAIFRGIDPTAPLIVAEAVWEYTSHILAGLVRHRGPILTLANWSGEWPGLVGMLNVNCAQTLQGRRRARRGRAIVRHPRVIGEPDARDRDRVRLRVSRRKLVRPGFYPGG